MGMIDADYVDQQQALLPRGAAWRRDADALLTALLTAKAQEYARADARVESLPTEANPATTAELLSDWERVAGLPDNCSGTLATTLQGRRNDLVAKLNALGGQSLPYFVSLASAMGFKVSIDEPQPFRAGISRARDRCCDAGWIYTWIVRAPATTITYFRAGVSRAGEPLATWGNDALECRFRQLKPAHTTVLFAYGPTGMSLLVDGDGSPIADSSGHNLAEVV